MIKKRLSSENEELRDWWDKMNSERDLTGMRMKHNLTIFPYFRCECGKIDAILDPDCNKDSRCEEFVKARDGRVLLMKPGRTPVYVCEYCYNHIKNNSNRYGDSVR